MNVTSTATITAGRQRLSSGLGLLALAILGLFEGSPMAHAFSVSSESFKAGARLPEKNVFRGFGCEGENQSPPLKWTAPPKGTKSFAVTMYDPDAPTGSGWWHWTVFNIPASVTSLAPGAGNDSSLLPEGAQQGRTDFGKAGYGGPCPPMGHKPHRYMFTVHALKVEHLDIGEEASGAMVGYSLGQNTLGRATLVGKYQRKK